MDIQEDSQLSVYRERLLEALRHPSRQAREDPGLLQVFVNHECIGTLDCSHADPTLVYASHERPIHTVEIRTEAGLLVGSFCAQDVGAKAVRFPVGRHAIEMSVHTRLDGGIIRMKYQAAKGWRHRLHSAVASFMGGLPGLDQREHAWTRALAVTQVVLALAVLFLGGSRGGPREVSGDRRAGVAYFYPFQHQSGHLIGSLGSPGAETRPAYASPGSGVEDSADAARGNRTGQPNRGGCG